MSNFNKSYRIRTEVGKDTNVHVNLDRDYDILEIMSLKINQENAYKFHTSNYGVIAGRVLANDAFGVPNAKVSVFIQIDENDINDTVKSVLYPYNNTQSKDKDNIRYNLLPNEKVNACHTTIGTFPEKQYLLDNNSVLEVFEKYYKYTTRTNNAGDYMIFGVPTGNQTIHVDIDLSDIGVLSQKPRDMFYKGYNVEAFESPNKFKHDTNLESLVQVISQDTITNVIPFWGEESESSIGITRCDINIQYKFEPTCVFLGSIVSDTTSNGISKKCIPTPGMGSMEEIVTGAGTIEMIRKTPSGDVEEIQIKGNHLINGDGVWCYQIPMNLDYMMTDEFGNMVPTNHPERGIPTRTRVRFRISINDSESEYTNFSVCKMLVPHNPDVYNNDTALDEIDYNFGTNTKECSYRDLFWNGVYSVKSYIPRIQKGTSWKSEKFTGFKRVNYYNDNNPIPYNNIRIKIPFIFTIVCAMVKSMIRSAAFLNWLFRLLCTSFTSIEDDDDGESTVIKSGSFISISGELCNDNLDYLCIIPGIDIRKIADKNSYRRRWRKRKSLLSSAILKHAEELGVDFSKLSNNEWANGFIDGPLDENGNVTYKNVYNDSKSIDSNNGLSIDEKDKIYHANDGEKPEFSSVTIVPTDEEEGKGKKAGRLYLVTLRGIRVTDSVDYLIQCIEIKLALEYKVIQFDFYNDWINGLVYIPRWMRTINKKKTYFWGAIKTEKKVKACNENTKANVNLVQQCSLKHAIDSHTNLPVITNTGCQEREHLDTKLYCHKSTNVRQNKRIFKDSGLVRSFKNMNNQYVYYFKPIDSSSNKLVRLFATDIVLLGTLNECDKWGIPNNLENLTASTYQMPPNLALTDSDMEGNDYETRLRDGSRYIYTETYVNRARTNKIDLGGCYTGIYPTEEDANYTEISGIDWAYEGPLQRYRKPGLTTPTKLYKPGGHFLGISCRNAETSIKSCVNLSRICEYGVWMSQRQELSIPNPNIKENDENDYFLNYATIPTGIISKDEISDTNYRRIFSTLNKNKLKTKINPETGYPVYDFEYINPTNFGGDLHLRVMSFNVDPYYATGRDSQYLNRAVTVLEKEQYVEYKDDDNYIRKSKTETPLPTPEIEIVRTGEFSDAEYLKYRFGLNDTDFNEKGVINLEAAKTRFLINGEKDNVKYVSFPLYDNSFYFYFGLHSGNTAIDEFKRTYFSKCTENELNELVNTGFSLVGLRQEYDGISGINDSSGKIIFDKINADEWYFDSGDSNNKPFKVTLKNPEGTTNKTVNIDKGNNTQVNFNFEGLKSGEYTIVVEHTPTGTTSTYTEYVGRISFEIDVTGVEFKKEVSSWTNEDKYKGKGINRENLGGYISINGNSITYVKSETETENINIFDNTTIYKYIIKSSDNSITIEGSGTNVTYNNESISLTKNYDGNYMIPVPKEDVNYEIEIYGYVDGNKPKNTGKSGNSLIKTTSFIKKTNIPINNGTKFDLLYNGISYLDTISMYTNNSTHKDSYNGWWNEGEEVDKESAYPRPYWYDENDDVTNWKIKSSLYMDVINDNKNPHVINLTPVGGIPPYTETLEGEEEDLYTRFSLNDTSKLKEITIPTINYSNNGGQRSNFVYNVIDINKQKLPENGNFVIPVIYKPFFMEIALCHYEDYGTYMCGNIYNGKTWKETEGFNNSYLNGQKIPAFKTSIPDTFFGLNEIDSNNKKHTGGGLGYIGSLQKYNGRKIYVNRALSSLDVYDITTSGSVFPCELTVGSSKMYNNVTYENSTTIKNDNLKFFNFTISTRLVNNQYSIKVNIKNDNPLVTNYKIYSIIDGPAEKNGCYPYPFNKSNGSPIMANTLLFRHIMDGNLKSYFDGNGTTSPKEISISDENLKSRNLYYIAIPDYDKESITTTNVNNILKSVTISSLIDFKTLNKFYPLNLSFNEQFCTDTLTKDGNFITSIKLFGRDIASINNISGKTFTLRFYSDNKKSEIVYTKTIEPELNEELVWKPTITERAKIGIRHNESTSNGTITNIYFDYKATIMSENISSPAFYDLIELPIKFIRE
jgi:hypothetical protein